MNRSTLRILLLAVLGAVFSFSIPTHALAEEQRSPAIEEAVIFPPGEWGYQNFRIPAVISSAKGTLLAFCEGGTDGLSDNGNIDTVLRRSTDGGKTWGPLQLIADNGKDAVMNPCPVLDRKTGRIWLPLASKAGENSHEENKRGTGRGTLQLEMLYSDDDGATWSQRKNITAAVNPEKWPFYVVGPGCGIQLKDGRLVLPSFHRIANAKDDNASISHVIFSDDSGKTWQLGGSTSEWTNECQIVELNDGRLMLNMRSNHKKNRRAIAYSSDRGATWTDATIDENLIDPTCQGSIITIRGEVGKSRLLFSNCASKSRKRMMVRLSEDDGKSWPRELLLYDGRAAYSSLVELPDGMVGCLYEKEKDRRIVFARFPLTALQPATPVSAN